MEEKRIKKMAEPPGSSASLATAAGPAVTPTSRTEQDLTVYFAPSASDAETRGITDALRLSLADFSERVVETMERFNEKYKWELEVNGEIKVYGVFSGSAKLKISPK